MIVKLAKRKQAAEIEKIFENLEKDGVITGPSSLVEINLEEDEILQEESDDENEQKQKENRWRQPALALGHKSLERRKQHAEEEPQQHGHGQTDHGGSRGPR